MIYKLILIGETDGKTGYSRSLEKGCENDAEALAWLDEGRHALHDIYGSVWWKLTDETGRKVSAFGLL